MLKQRMYHLILYQLSPIQKGIQAYHSGMEYANTFWNNEDFQKWLKEDKTVIILDGGTTEDMTNHLILLESSMKIRVKSFQEPDLGNLTTALSFLVDETVWNEEKYPKLFEDVSWNNSLLRDYLLKLKLAI